MGYAEFIKNVDPVPDFWLPAGYRLVPTAGGGDNILIALGFGEQILKGEDMFDPDDIDCVKLRNELFTEIDNNKDKYGVEINSKNKLEWNKLKRSGVSLPMIFVHAFCNLFKFKIHVFFGAEKPLVILPFGTDHDKTLPLITLQLLGNNHFNAIKIDSPRDIIQTDTSMVVQVEKTKTNKSTRQVFTDQKIPIIPQVKEKIKSIPINLTTDYDEVKGFPNDGRNIICEHNYTNLSVTQIYFTEFRTDPYCCLWDTGSSINLISEKMANKLLDMKIATLGPSEEVNIAGSGGKSLKMTMRYVEISIFFKKKLNYKYLIFGIMPDDKMPACVILSFNMMSRYGISLNYDRMTLHSFGDEIQCMGRVGDENRHRVGKVDFNDPLQYLTGGLDIPRLPIDKTIKVRQGFQKDYLLSKKLETDDAIIQNRPPSLHKQEDITRHDKEYLGLSRCFQIDNGDPR